MYKQRVSLLLKSAIDEIKFAIDTTKDVVDESYFGTTTAGMILFRSSCLCIQNMAEAFVQIDNLTEKRLWIKGSDPLIQRRLCRFADHFPSTGKMVEFDRSSVREITDYMFIRYV